MKLKSLLLSNAIFVFAGSLLLPVYALFITNIGGGPVLAGILFATHFVASSLVSLVIIHLKDKKSFSEHLLTLNFLIRGVAWAVIAIKQDIPTLFVVQAFAGMSEALGSPAFNALISENLDAKKHVSEWGMWELIKNPIIAVASVLSGIIVKELGFSTLFGIMSLLCFTTFGFFKLSYRKRQ